MKGRFALLKEILYVAKVSHGLMQNAKAIRIFHFINFIKAQLKY